jgi:hypothetical protein
MSDQLKIIRNKNRGSKRKFVKENINVRNVKPFKINHNSIEIEASEHNLFP